MGYEYAVLGAGRQGTTAAHDLARHGDADRVLVCDLDPGAARRAAQRLNRALDRPAAPYVEALRRRGFAVEERVTPA